jgi:hypothetical protein
MKLRFKLGDLVWVKWDGKDIKGVVEHALDVGYEVSTHLGLLYLAADSVSKRDPAKNSI